jgi:hypothetical protein
MADDLKCLRCGGPLEEGFIPEFTGHGSCQMPWVEGRPETSFWSGLKINDRRCLKTFTYRCTQCGRLESFAREPFE